MEKFNTFKKHILAATVMVCASQSSFVYAFDDQETESQTSAETQTQDKDASITKENKVEKKVEKKTKKDSDSKTLKSNLGSNDAHFHEIKFNDDLTSYQVIDGENAEKSEHDVSEDDTFYIKHDIPTREEWRKNRDRKVSKSYRFKKRDNDCWAFGRCNQRDGFHYAFSLVSSNGDNFYSDSTESTDLDKYASYRAQIAGFFFESPGVSTRRIHGLYADRSWGFNFYNTDQWRLDLYKNRDTRGIRGLDSIKSRNKFKRAGLRLTGFFDSSMLQMDVSPHSESDQNDDGVAASLSYSYFWQVRNWNFYGSAGMQFQGKEIVNYYEEIPESFAERSDRINRDVEFGFEYPLSEHFIIGGFASYSHTDQPLPNVLATDNGEHKGFRSGLLFSFVL